MVVHASMLLSMTGFVQGALMGWEGSVMCPVGQEFVAVQARGGEGDISGNRSGMGEMS